MNLNLNKQMKKISYYIIFKFVLLKSTQNIQKYLKA